VYLMEEYSLSHGLCMGDALIAATVESAGETLLTANVAHYKPLPNVSLKAFRV